LAQSVWGSPPANLARRAAEVAADLKQRAKGRCGRTLRKIAERLGVNPGTVQTISMELSGRPFERSEGASAAV
jgi:DNA-binding NarL/FixJ family response regulator